MNPHHPHCVVIWLNFYQIAGTLHAFKEDENLLRNFFPIDIYEDESLGNKKSLTIRFVIQSMEDTLAEEQIESVMKRILEILETSHGAELR